jgi:hypothetical protein
MALRFLGVPPPPPPPESPTAAGLAGGRRLPSSAAALQAECPLRYPCRNCPCATAPPDVGCARPHGWLARPPPRGQRSITPPTTCGPHGRERRRSIEGRCCAGTPRLGATGKVVSGVSDCSTRTPPAKAAATPSASSARVVCPVPAGCFLLTVALSQPSATDSTDGQSSAGGGWLTVRTPYCRSLTVGSPGIVSGVFGGFPRAIEGMETMLTVPTMLPPS